MAPGLSLARLFWLCSNSSANDSVIGKKSRLEIQTGVCVFCAYVDPPVVGLRGIAYGRGCCDGITRAEYSAGALACRSGSNPRRPATAPGRVRPPRR
jgi:hypothetical protein